MKLHGGGNCVCLALTTLLVLMEAVLGNAEGIDLQRIQIFSKLAELNQIFTQCIFQKSIFKCVINIPETFKMRSRQSWVIQTNNPEVKQIIYNPTHMTKFVWWTEHDWLTIWLVGLNSHINIIQVQQTVCFISD